MITGDHWWKQVNQNELEKTFAQSLTKQKNLFIFYYKPIIQNLKVFVSKSFVWQNYGRFCKNWKATFKTTNKPDESLMLQEVNWEICWGILFELFHSLISIVFLKFIYFMFNTSVANFQLVKLHFSTSLYQPSIICWNNSSRLNQLRYENKYVEMTYINIA